MAADISAKSKKIKLFIFDIDGVLTDGKIIYTDTGQELKFFDVKDGHGIKIMQRAGIEAAFITARNSKVVQVRAEDLGIKYVYQGNLNKLEAFDDLLTKTGLDPAEVAYIGDDIIDLPILTRVGLSFAVGDAVDEVKGAVDVVTAKFGGNGAVREAVELLLKSAGHWDKATERYRV